MKNLASLISWIFLPLFAPIYGLILVLYLPVNSNSFVASESLYLLYPEVKMLFLLLFLVFTVFAPGLSLLILRLNKTITSLQLESKEERLTPIAIMTFYFCVLYLFLLFQAESALIPAIIKAMALGGALASLLSYFITKKIKISLHAIAMGSLFGFVYMFAVPLSESPIFTLSALVLASGIVLSARLILKAHTLKEVSWGYLLGFASQVFCIYFYP
ncbi:hypothetical protein CW751_05325 [Brumimicrobium salinarum]|uniref:PAP2 family protein n=1 Tax=Brumimicrobium salinarum TaxID=2058658 RepID=A0A2I0R4G6_9FLAO|nr:hypothetical protein [Brumimicrobium salinarum]PKR81474.1 hypothetical protein CW751_05325 [Brumimicrobium salinarum]